MFDHFFRSKKARFFQGLSFLLVGLFLLGVFSFWRFHQARILSFFGKELPSVSSERTGEIPVFIKSFPLGVNVEIKEATIKNGVWQVFSGAVSHLISSARIGETGNMILYGHNKNEVLGPIRWAKVGEKITLTGKDGKEYFYEVVKIETVKPTNLDYLLPTKEETLTVYTCVGLMDRERFVVVAKRIDSELPKR